MKPETDPLELFFQMGEEQYGQNWANESTQWNQRDVYKKIASMLALKENGRHLDAGSGWGHLLGYVQKRNLLEEKNMNLLGVDINPYLAVNAKWFLDREKLPANICIGTAARQGVVDGQLKIWREFAGPDNAQDIERLLAPNAISLIVDDMRDAKVLRKILGDRLLSSATFLFPGAGAYLAYAAPFIPRTNGTEDERARVAKNMTHTRDKAYSLLASCMERDGHLILAERIRKDKNMNDDEIVADAKTRIFINIGSSKAAWDIEDVQVTRGGDTGVTSPFEWVVPGENGTMKNREDVRKEGDGHGVMLIGLRRNRFKVRA